MVVSKRDESKYQSCYEEVLNVTVLKWEDQGLEGQEALYVLITPT